MDSSHSCRVRVRTDDRTGDGRGEIARVTVSELVPEKLVFYDKEGRAVAYTPDREHIYAFPGIPLAYREGSSVYTFTGEHLGWWEQGWLWDHAGAAALFVGRALGGPARPPTRETPRPGRPWKLPRRMHQESAPPQPSPVAEWSPRSGLHFFDPPAVRPPTWTELVDRALAQWEGMTGREVGERLGIRPDVIRQWRRRRSKREPILQVRGRNAEVLLRFLERGFDEGVIPLQARVHPYRRPARKG